MRQLNYNFSLIKEFKIGEYKIPFLFTLDKIRAFPDQRPVVEVDSSKDYSIGYIVEEYKQRAFLYVLPDFYLTMDEDLDNEWLSDFNSEDYEVINSKVFIRSPRLFFEFISSIEGFEKHTLSQLKSFIYDGEGKLIKSFYNKVLDDLEYMKSDSIESNDVLHFMQWALGETSTNPNPFFSENLNKPTIEWSWREIELRNIYKSKTFMIENAIEKLKAKMLEDAKKKSQ